ncbi:MAG TPA: hypothetical protein VIY48_14995 [Candidatus Paceibacterota bacterium]|jgi:hypothetical protein
MNKCQWFVPSLEEVCGEPTDITIKAFDRGNIFLVFICSRHMKIYDSKAARKRAYDRQRRARKD